MNRLTKALVIATSLMTATGLQAQTTEQQAVSTTHTMQRYTFTYDFNNTVHPVIKFIKERQQLIQYDLVTEVQQSAYRTIDEMGSSTLVASQLVIPSVNVTLVK